jgi:hypothetical protein
MLSFLDPRTVKDLDDIREKCRSAIPNIDRHTTSEVRLRPNSSSLATGSRSKSGKGRKLEKNSSDQASTSKKRSKASGNKPCRVTINARNDEDDAEENQIRLVDEPELDDEGM